MSKSLERFFTKGQIGNTTLKDVFEKKIPSAFEKVSIKPIVIKPLKMPVIDAKTKQFFEKDVKNFIVNDVKNGIADIAGAAKNAIQMPKLMTDLMTNVTSGLNTPLLLPGLLIIGAIVTIQVLKAK